MNISRLFPGRLGMAVMATLIAGSVAAIAANTTFITSIGDLILPFTAPTKSAPGTIDNMVIGGTTPQNITGKAIVGTTISGAITNTNPTPLTQGAPFAATVSATLTAANLQTGIITVLQGSGANSALTLPLATAMDTAFPAAVAGSAFDFSVVNISVTAAETATVTTNTGWTLVGGMVVPAVSAAGADSSVRFRARKTGTGAWTLYRFS